MPSSKKVIALFIAGAAICAPRATAQETSRLNQVLDAIAKSETRKIKVAITDIDGVLRGKYMHRDKFLSAARGGFGFCNVVFGWDAADVCYDNVSYTGWHTGYPDAQARLDLDTHRNVPWDGNVPFFLGEFVTDDGEPLPICPRQTLRRVIARAEGG